MAVSHRSNEIPAYLQTGILALKWPEVIKKSANPSIVTLSIDTKGFYLICLNKGKKETECFDIALIHDTRTGTQVSLPSDEGNCNKMDMGILDVALTSKWLTIYYGNTFVPSSELRTIHFSFECPSYARELAELLFRYGHNPFLRNLSSLECLEKIHSRIINELIDLDKKTISVRRLAEFLNKNPRDFNKEKRICQILEYLKLPNQMKSAIKQDQFTFNIFFRLYMHLMERNEIDEVFYVIGGKNRGYLSWENMKVFIKKQNDMYDDSVEMDCYEQKAKDLIKKYTQYDENSNNRGMNDESFLRYLLSSDNLVFDPTKLNLFMDMNKPLAHYFIASSHNTYITANQITGRASTEMYRQVLLTGCRCIELDVVDSQDEPEIKHKNTPMQPILFIDVIVTIRDYAFKVSSYPLILSIENHCGPRAQAKMAQYFVDIFGDKLLIEPLKTHPCEENCPLPSPNDLQYKILIKNKKLNPNPISKLNNQNVQMSIPKPGTISATSSSGQSTGASTDASSPALSHLIASSDEMFRYNEAIIKLLNQQPRHGKIIDDEGFSDEDTPINEIPANVLHSSTVDPLRETKATKAMSDLVQYIVPIRFKTFTYAQERNRSFEMSSFTEDRAQNLIQTYPKDFLAYNQRQLSRIYPRGTRFDSTNYNPYIYWSIGCQMVALNYQTLDVPMQLNLGLFSFNGGCGYIKKPTTLCESRCLFDPRAKKNVENVVSYDIDIKVISGQFLCQDREPTYVNIQMYGTYGDINKRNEYQLRAKQWNGFQAIYDDTNIGSNKNSIRFSKIILPEMAAIRFIVLTDDGMFLGQSFIPITHLRPGYRHIVLRNEINIPTQSSSLFIFIRRNIYINSKDEELVDKLVEPLLDHSLYLNKSEIDSNNFNELPSNIFIRNHNPSLNRNDDKQKTPTVLHDTNWYQKHLIAASKLHDKKNLCKVFSVNDCESRDIILKRDQTIHNLARSVSMNYQKKIQKEEDRFQKYLQLQGDRSLTLNNPPNKNRTINIFNKKDIEQIEQSLLQLYSEKLHQQEELEKKILNEHYTKLEKDINNDYKQQLYKIDVIRKEEISRVNEHVQLQMKREIDTIKMTETDRNTINMLKEKSAQMNANVGASTIQTLEEMYEEIKDILQINKKKSLDQLEEKRRIEKENSTERYINRFNELKVQLQRQMHRNEYDTSYDGSSSLSNYSKIGASASWAGVHHSSESNTSNPSQRRQTLQE